MTLDGREGGFLRGDPNGASAACDRKVELFRQEQQLANQFARFLISLSRLLGEHPADDSDCLVAQIRASLPQVWRIISAMTQQFLQYGIKDSNQ